MNNIHAGNAVTSKELAPFLLTFTYKDINLNHTGYLKF